MVSRSGVGVFLRYRVRGIAHRWSTGFRNLALNRRARRLVREVAARCDLRDVEPFIDHLDRKLFKAVHAGGPAILKLYNVTDVEDAQRSLRMQALLAGAGIPVPRMLAADVSAETVARHGFGYVLAEWVEGAHLDPSDAATAPDVFHWLARLACVEGPAVLPADRVLDLEHARRYIKLTRNRCRRAGIEIRDSEYEWVNRRVAYLLKRLFAAALPSCPIHLDLKPDNFLRRADGTLVVVDLDGLGYGHPLLCLGKGLLSFAVGKHAAEIGGQPLRTTIGDPRLTPLYEAFFEGVPALWREVFDAHREAVLLWAHMRMTSFAALRSMHTVRSDFAMRRFLKREAQERWDRLLEHLREEKRTRKRQRRQGA